ncbi:Protein of unknown function [Catalinimonas alkaloidigena]|uniref:DUF4240 domain-containing protein n=1 Tax=Catalinimonas alkaloidigena TaxID=1075417 RepID=A0A1G9QE90_9BACT|nr:DUF4240 domain-containing protein [Catalinimonas alkaloidigena]SDM08645.1 Protein of unknown function [Catalinimonas alkaloidigena]
MDEAQFWEIIEESRTDTKSAEEHGRALARTLRDLDDDELEAFEEIFWDVRARADQPDLIRLVQTLTDVKDEETIMDFKDWLVSLGRERFYDIVQQPDLLLEFQNTLVAWDIPSGLIFSAIYQAQEGISDEEE